MPVFETCFLKVSAFRGRSQRAVSRNSGSRDSRSRASIRVRTRRRQGGCWLTSPPSGERCAASEERRMSTQGMETRIDGVGEATAGRRLVTQVASLDELVGAHPEAIRKIYGAGRPT